MTIIEAIKSGKAKALDNKCMLKHIKSFVARFKTRKIAAQSIGISPAYMNDILNARREISEFVASQFGFKRKVVFISADDWIVRDE